ncbi:hypothetical protein ACHAXN_000602 [Cyclotella atomus]
MPILTQAVNQLTAEADLMTRFENDLEAITSQQGYRVDDVVDLVIDNDMTLEKQKINLRMIAVFYVAKLFFNEDVNVSLERVRVLIHRLQLELNPRGIEVNSEMLEDLVKRRGIYGLLQFCSKFLFSSIDKYERGDEMEMFLLQSMFTRGSVRGARGLKPLLANIKSPEPRNAVSRRVRMELALRLPAKKGAKPPMPREITFQPDIIDEEMNIEGLHEPFDEQCTSSFSPKSGKKRAKWETLDAMEEVNPVLNELPDAPMSLIAEYLDKTQRALLCVAMSAPASSWGKHQWKVKPHYAAKTILSAQLAEKLQKTHNDEYPSLEPWQVFDFATASPLLTDTLLGGMLVCIDAVHKVKVLKLTYCYKVTGSGLEVLRNSRVLEQIDLSLVDTHELPTIPNETMISVDEVVPILDFMIQNSNSLKQIQIPKRWQEDRRPLLSQFLSRFDQILRDRQLTCSICNNLCQPNPAFPIVVQRGESYGLQYYTCYKCLNNFCSDPDHNFNFCQRCKKKFCPACIPVLECQECQEMACHMCTQVQPCDECNRVSCSNCVPVVHCEFCKRSRCMDCSEYLMCSDDACGKINCFECVPSDPGDPRFVYQCYDCEGEFCGTCDPLEQCEDDMGDYCTDCHKARCNRTELRAELRRRSQEGDTTRPKCWRKYEKPTASKRIARRRS